MIHPAFEPDRNWQTRQQAEQARLAMENERHARNVEAARFFANVLAVVIMGVVFVSGLRAAINAGLFAWITN